MATRNASASWSCEDGLALLDALIASGDPSLVCILGFLFSSARLNIFRREYKKAQMSETYLPDHLSQRLRYRAPPHSILHFLLHRTPAPLLPELWYLVSEYCGDEWQPRPHSERAGLLDPCLDWLPTSSWEGLYEQVISAALTTPLPHFWCRDEGSRHWSFLSAEIDSPGDGDSRRVGVLEPELDWKAIVAVVDQCMASKGSRDIRVTCKIHERHQQESERVHRLAFLSMLAHPTMREYNRNDVRIPHTEWHCLLPAAISANIGDRRLDWWAPDMQWKSPLYALLWSPRVLRAWRFLGAGFVPLLSGWRHLLDYRDATVISLAVDYRFHSEYLVGIEGQDDAATPLLLDLVLRGRFRQ